MRFTADLQPLSDGSPPSSFLVPASTAQHVRHFAPFTNVRFDTTVSECSVKVYGHNIKPTEVQKNACSLQGWMKRRVVQSTRYWTVDMSAESTTCCPDSHDQSNDPQ
jgi:hypothetical protein